jgi:hypothetical protein
MKINFKKIKKKNDNFIFQKYGRNSDFLPNLNMNHSYLKKDIEIKQRVTVLSVILQASFKSISFYDAKGYLYYHNLYSFLTKKENYFLDNPNPTQVTYETWKTECIYVLLWSLGVNLDIRNVTELGDLDKIRSNQCPFLNLNTGPEAFFLNPTLKRRNTIELLEMLDYFSRLDYICDIDTLNLKTNQMNSALIYERRYALLWLVTQNSWDQIECNAIL